VIVQPNQAKVAVFLGRYMGTVRRSGFHRVNPLTTRRTLSLRIRNLDTDVLKVHDANGNPIEVSAVITWQVRDAAQAVFDTRLRRLAYAPEGPNRWSTAARCIHEPLHGRPQGLPPAHRPAPP
jgi:regulator of protease activity HflC (stomatin/prohibitin superfamily)